VNDPTPFFVAAVLLGAVGMWLLLPPMGKRGRMAGLVLAVAGLGTLASQMPWLGKWTDQGVFSILAGVTVVAAAAAVTSRNPVYSALWLGLSMLGTAGLLLFAGVQLPAVVVVIVYAGVIPISVLLIPKLLGFLTRQTSRREPVSESCQSNPARNGKNPEANLPASGSCELGSGAAAPIGRRPSRLVLFVLMQLRSKAWAKDDRTSWEAMISATTGAVITGVLAIAVSGTASLADLPQPAASGRPQARLPAAIHEIRLGEELFSRHLLAIAVVSLLALAALGGAAAILSRVRARSAGDNPTQPRTCPRGGQQQVE